MSERAKADKISLDALVSAASDATRRSNDVSSKLIPQRATPATADLDALVSQFDTGHGGDKPATRRNQTSSRPTPAATHNRSPGSDAPDFAKLAAEAAGDAAPRGTANSGSVGKHVSPTIADAVALALPQGSDVGRASQIDSQTLVSAVGKAAMPDPQPPRGSAWSSMNVTLRGTMTVLTGVAILAAAVTYYRNRPVPTDPGPPLKQAQPVFALSAKQQELVGHLREVRAEVERYRKENGRLPVRIERKVSGVVFYIRTVKDSYMLMAVSEHQNLVLMGDGLWYKAR